MKACPKCGKPREKKYKSESGNGQGKSYDANRPDGRIFNGRNRQSIKEFIGYSSCFCGALFRPGVVLDCFGGSGTVGVVAHKLGRDYILIEQNPEYVEMAQRRLEPLEQQGRLI